jgi:hypothetical protein
VKPIDSVEIKHAGSESLGKGNPLLDWGRSSPEELQKGFRFNICIRGLVHEAKHLVCGIANIA